MENKKAVHLAVLHQMSALAASAFGLVAALAWNDAIQTLIKQVFPMQSELLGKFVYAVILTALIVVVTTLFSRATERFKQKHS